MRVMRYRLYIRAGLVSPTISGDALTLASSDEFPMNSPRTSENTYVPGTWVNRGKKLLNFSYR
jgi:hypothetical protein